MGLARAYLISGLFLVLGLWLRLKLHESPVFQKIKSEGTGSKAPLKDAFGKWSNLKIVLIAFWRHRGAGGRVVHGPALCDVFP
jgi:hypothetical protein